MNSVLYCSNVNNIVTCIPIARQRLGKHIPERANVRKNRTCIARQRASKHASLKIETVCSVRFVPRAKDATE
jgi:hypothetical protein